MRNQVNLIGSTFGKWSVIDISEKKRYEQFWKCVCECGKVFNIAQYNLIHKISTQCRFCAAKESVSKRQKKRIDLTGQIFGRLQVIKYHDKINNQHCWECLCECGNICIAQTKQLKAGHRKSCNCLYNKKDKEHNPNWKGYEIISGKLWSTIKNCKDRKGRILDFNITKEYIYNLYLSQNGKCAISGIDLCFSSDHKTFDRTASLDRIDSSKGYIMGNVQWVHKVVNRMKWNSDQEEFIEWCKIISNYQQKESKN